MLSAFKYLDDKPCSRLNIEPQLSELLVDHPSRVCADIDPGRPSRGQLQRRSSVDLQLAGAGQDQDDLRMVQLDLDWTEATPPESCHRDYEHEVEEEPEPGSAPALAFVERTDARRREVAGVRSRHRTVSALAATATTLVPALSPSSRQLAAASSSSPSRIAAVAPTAR
jgi:hypothetical protein